MVCTSDYNMFSTLLNFTVTIRDTASLSGSVSSPLIIFGYAYNFVSFSSNHSPFNSRYVSNYLLPSSCLASTTLIISENVHDTTLPGENPGDKPIYIPANTT